MSQQPTNKPVDEILTPNQVAEMLMVSPAAVRQWASKGDLSALTTPGGHRRFKISDVVNFAQSRGMSLSAHLGHASILIVDDDVQFASYLKELMESHDERCEVHLAHDGFEAGRLVHNIKPSLIFLDLRMPTMDGFETCRRLKADKETKKIRIIAMTGMKDGTHEERALSLGAEACLYKPIDEDAVTVYLDKLFA